MPISGLVAIMKDRYNAVGTVHRYSNTEACIAQSVQCTVIAIKKPV